MNDEELLKLVNEYLEYQPNGELIWRKSRGSRAKAGQIAGWDINNYRNVNLNGKPYRIHRINYLIHHGRMPIMVDHLNQCKSDNRIENLRQSDRSQNAGNQNLRKDNTSGFRGVHWYKPSNKWVAQLGIMVNGKSKQKHLGYFDCPKEAYEAYKKAAKDYFGEFFPEDLE